MERKSQVLVRLSSLVLMSLFLVLLSACLNSTNLKVTIDPQNGESTTIVDVIKGNTITEPSKPSKEGYVFGGWYVDLDDAKAFSFKTAINQNMTLYAKWLNEYTVSFNVDGGSDVGEVTFGEGQIPKAPTAPTKSGFSFAGWYLENTYQTKYEFKTALNSSVTLYAKWEVVLSDQEKVSGDLVALEFPSQTQTNLVFPIRGENGSRLTWESSKPHVITNKGVVLFGGINQGEQVVSITVTSTSGQVTDTKTFDILVGGSSEVSITTVKNVLFESVSDEYIVASSDIDLYFQQDGFLPYVDISEFLMLLDGAIESVAGDPVEITADDGQIYDVVKYMEIDETAPNIIKVSMITEYYQEGVLSETEVYEAILDFEANTFYSESFDFLDSLGAATSTDFGQGLSFGDSIYTEGSALEIPLGDYRFDLVTYEDDGLKYLMPLQVANLLFVGQVYYDVYYNGDKLYGVDSYQFLDGEAIVESTVKNSSYNSLSATREERIATYDFIVLAFDYFYGLKDVNGVETYYDVFGTYVDDITMGYDLAHYEAIFNLTYSMDDLHTYHITTGYYADKGTSFQLSYAQLGSRMKAYYDAYGAIEDELNALYSQVSLPPVRVTEDGLTAIIAIEGFDVSTPDMFKRNLDLIAKEHPSVVNVVVDLSINGGGNVGAVWRTLGYMTDDVIYYHSQNPTTKATVSYTIYDEYDKYNYNWFVLISPMTFSAANMMASTVQEQGIAKVIGIKSSGGASSVSGLVTPTGDVLFYSSTSVISRKLIDGSFESVEYGIVPDVAFNEYAELFDLTYIQGVVNAN